MLGMSVTQPSAEVNARTDEMSGSRLPKELASTTALDSMTQQDSRNHTRTHSNSPLHWRDAKEPRKFITVGEFQERTMSKASMQHQRAQYIDSIINIPELFEDILSQLSFLDLVIATGVNTAFREFILGSERLQRRLFLLPNKPQGTRRQRKFFDKSGIYGPFLESYDCLEVLGDLNPSPVTLCPFLLEPSHSPRTAHLSTRAAEAHFWPRMYLTDPPCAHAFINFTYNGTNTEGMYVLIEAGRSIYRRGGVTFAAIEEALSQLGGVKVSYGALSKSKRTTGKREERHVTPTLRQTTVARQVARCEKHYKCKLYMDLRATTIKLHGEPVVSGEMTSRSMIPVGGIQALYGMNARKIRFED